MAFCSSSFAAALLCLLGVAQGVSVMQLKADLVATSGVGQAPFSVDKELAAMSAAVQRMQQMVDAANSTLSGMLDQCVESADTFGQHLAQLQSNVDTFSTFPGMVGGDYAKIADGFIARANSAILQSKTTLQSAFTNNSAKLPSIMEALSSADNTTRKQFEDAVSAVQSALNQIPSTSLNVQTPAHHNDVLLMTKRAKRAKRHGSGAATVDSAVQRKGTAGVEVNLCEAAMALVEKANSTLASMPGHFTEANSTAVALLVSVKAPIGEAFAAFNATLAPDLAILVTIPGGLVAPATAAVKTVLAIAATLSKEVDAQVRAISSQVVAAQQALSPAYAATKSLLAAIKFACVQGACGEALQATCKAPAH